MVSSYLAPPSVLILSARFSLSAAGSVRGLIAILCVVGVILYSQWHKRAMRWGWRLLSASAADVLECSGRPLVLYLRSFSHDTTYFPTESPRGFLRSVFRPDLSIGSRPEERLLIVAHGIGPMIALGRPGERLPQIGAARLYIERTADDEEWKQAVRDLCLRAGLVIVQVGPPTPGLLWEIQNVSKLIAPEKLVVYIPSLTESKPRKSPTSLDGFLRQYASCFPQQLPNELGDARCIVFDADWNPIEVGPWSLPIRSNPAVLNVHHGLFTTPADLGLDEDTISLLSAIERNYPEYSLPQEYDLPFDLRVYRTFDILFGPFGKLTVVIALVVILWPDSIRQLQLWLSKWL